MKYFFDTEFIEYPHTIDIISIGIVDEDGRELYLESNEVDWSKANQWVLDNVRPHLTGDNMSQSTMAYDIRSFVLAGDTKPEFWAYYGAYDWVALCWLFGPMMSLPSGWPMYCNDLKQLAMTLGNPKLPKQTSTEHHALADARWNKEVYDFLISYPWG